MTTPPLLKASAGFLVLHVYFTLAALSGGALPQPAHAVHIHTLSLLTFSTLHALHFLGARRMLTLFVLGAVISWSFEQAGVATGLVYGPYYYTDKLGLKLGHVPLLIPLAWFMMIYPSYVIASLLQSGRANAESRALTQTLWLSAIGALVMTGWDLPMDPQMVADGHWVWSEGGPYFGVPLRNFAGWLVTTFCVYLAYGSVAPRLGPAPNRRPAAFMPLIAYGTFAVYYAVSAKPEALRVIALYSMGVPVLLAVARLRAHRPADAHDAAGPPVR